MDYSVRSVSLSQIDTTDQTFRITTNTDYLDLVSSIERLGLLQPPLLVPKGQVYRVVCGFRRIAACQSIPIPSIPAHIEKDDLPEIQHARMAIADNAFQRQLNVVEQSRALALIMRFDSANWQTNAENAGLPSSRAAVNRLLPIVDMPESLQKAIVNGSIALPVALSINKLQEDDGMVVSSLLQRINTGLNIQRELLELLVELSIINEMSISRLLEQKDIVTILSDNDSPLPQQVQHLRAALKKKRYPALSKAEDTFHREFKALNINPSIQLIPPRFFEGNAFRLAVSINSRKHLKSLLPDLEKLADHPHILPE